MPERERSQALVGTLCALGAFAFWGVLPVYWKAVGHLGTMTVVGHRVLWSLVVLIPLLAARGKLGPVVAAFGDRRLLLSHVWSGLLLGANWFLFILATLTDRVLEAALGYFLNPLFNVALGWWLLGEKRTRGQVVAVGLAAIGVIVQAMAVKGFPWIAFGLSVTFALYGLARKRSSLGSLEGLTVETLLMALPAIALVMLAPPGPCWTTTDYVLIVCAGLVTTIPLSLFATGARRMDLAALGMLQYLAPTLQFTVGHFVYHEPLSALRLCSFVLIWCGVAVFLRSGWKNRPALAT